MEFKMNNCVYAIKEVSQEELQKEIIKHMYGFGTEDGDFYCLESGYDVRNLLEILEDIE